MKAAIGDIITSKKYCQHRNGNSQFCFHGPCKVKVVFSDNSGFLVQNAKGNIDVLKCDEVASWNLQDL